MSGYLIKDTTREEREQIVAESLGNIEATLYERLSGDVSGLHRREEGAARD